MIFFKDEIEEIKKTINEDLSADNVGIPCKIEIKEKNFKKIREYLKQNKKINIKNFETVRDVKRVSIASICPYWCPVVPEKYELKIFEKTEKRKYTGLNNTDFIFYRRKPGCGFYEQFNSYIDSDVIVFNSLKYKLESAMNRKPITEVEIIDECDEFLDSFSNQRNINIDRLQNSLINIISFDEKTEKTINEMHEIIKHLKKDKKVEDAVHSRKILSLKETGIYDLFRIFLDSEEIFSEIDEESYFFDAEETARMFKDFFDETYITFSKKDNNLVASLITTNLAKKFKEMIDKNKIIILMSGTLHSEEVLKNIFGLENFKIIEAEIQHQGKIEIKKTGLEMDCKHSNLSYGEFSRKNYLKALSRCVKIAKRPVLVHVSAFSDLPSKQELDKHDIDNLISREKLIEIQNNDKTGKLIEEFKKGKINVLFTTKCSRGIDFPGEQCNSIIFTKYPNPNPQDAFWKILKKTKPQHYWSFYKDKARRELLQKVYRGLRFKEDHIYLLSPDIRVLKAFEK